MDRNTIIGLVLIGLTLSVFTIFNQPTEEEIAAQLEQAKNEQGEFKAETKESSAIKLDSNLVQKLDNDGNPLKDSSGGIWYKNKTTNIDTLILRQDLIDNKEKITPETPAEAVKGELITLSKRQKKLDLPLYQIQLSVFHFQE